MKKKLSAYQKREWLAGMLFLLPNFIGFLAFTAIPVVMGFIISLTDYSGFGNANFIGLENYIKMFRKLQVQVGHPHDKNCSA